MTTPNDHAVPRRHNPPPWETTSPLVPQQQRRLERQARRRQLPLIGSLLAARDYRRSVKTVYSRGFDGIDIGRRPDAALLHTYDADLNKRLTRGAGYDQLAGDFPDLNQESREFAYLDVDGPNIEPDPVFTEILDALAAIDRVRTHPTGDGRTAKQSAAEQQHWAGVIDQALADNPEMAERIVADDPDGRRRLDARYDTNPWATYSDDLVAGWAGDAMDRKRAYAAYGSNVEAPDSEDERAITEWHHRLATHTAAEIVDAGDSQPAPALDSHDLAVDPWPIDLADDLLAARRRGDADRAQQIRDQLTPARVDQLLGGRPGMWTGPVPEPGAPWVWTEHVNHLGDSAVFANPAAAATRDYIDLADADRDAGRPSPVDPDHPDHGHYLQRYRRHEELIEAQDRRDDQRAKFFAHEIATWAQTHEYDVAADSLAGDGSIVFAAATEADRDAVQLQMIDLRKQYAPDHLAFAAAVGDDRFTPATEQPQHDKAKEPDRRIEHDQIREHRQAEATEDAHPAAQATASNEPDHQRSADQAPPTQGEQQDEQMAGRVVSTTIPGPDPAQVYVTGSRGRESSTLYVSTQAELDLADAQESVDRGEDPAAGTQRLQLDRDEPRRARGRTEPIPAAPAPAAATTPAPQAVHEHVAAANRIVENHDAAGQVSPDVQRLQTAVDQHVARHDHEAPAADESPPHPPDIGREI